MKILATVGTTAFDEMIQAVDEMIDPAYKCIFQIANGSYLPVNGSWFRFSHDDPMYEWADIVITHAGAGSVFTLLEMGKKMLVVPNLKRRDPHQQELAEYVEREKFSQVCWDVTGIKDCVNLALEFIPKPYTTRKFFLSQELSKKIQDSFGL